MNDTHSTAPRLNVYTAWTFGKWLEAAGVLPSMGTVGDCYYNSMMESFWAMVHWNSSIKNCGKPEPSLPTLSSNG
jgi:transposase InsO family protein